MRFFDLKDLVRRLNERTITNEEFSNKMEDAYRDSFHLLKSDVYLLCQKEVKEILRNHKIYDYDGKLKLTVSKSYKEDMNGLHIRCSSIFDSSINEEIFERIKKVVEEYHLECIVLSSHVNDMTFSTIDSY